MPKSLVQNHQELDEWITSGMLYNEIIEIYREKYGIELKPAMLANYRKRRGLPSRQVRSNLVPRNLEPVHRGRYILDMLRLVARDRALKDESLSETDRKLVKPLSEREQTRMDAFLENLAAADAVVTYEADTEDGFYYVPRTEADQDIVRYVGIHAPVDE
ncbi:hypothetical protein [Actinoplanes sp. NPDC026670]|uniref:hypothetical protein n=1 Tax=Actinoplanes sp. NPDC026670 TaxID=3154700 RepID=UPI0033FC9E22